MRQLTFFTGNQTKLAHARYVAEQFPLRIVSFKQRTYHAGYIEPRIPSRDELLESSYRSALAQCERANLSPDSTVFMLEDTSICVDALSLDGVERPGTDAKFWMAEQTFEGLDKELKNRGNNRIAQVRSDVLLHIPRPLRAAWGTMNDYLIFTGTTHGKIVETEVEFETNAVFPWLDNQTFNKWFVPDGCEAPLGALDVDVADLHDFRRKSFRQAFEFLASVGYAFQESTQLELELDNSPTLLLCGYTCSGKTTAAQWLTREHGYLHVEASDFMHLSYLYRHGFRGPISIGDYAEDALRQKPYIAAERVLEYILAQPSTPIVISGFRSDAEVDFAEQMLADAGHKLIKCFVHADQAARFERLCERKRSDDQIDIGDLQKRDEQQGRMGLANIAESSEFRHITNDSSLSDYRKKISRLAQKAPKLKVDLDVDLAEAFTTRTVSLEDAILIALLSIWDDSERRISLTTTEVAKLINSKFLHSSCKKHKDNVSRYFNQDYYPYYEIFGTLKRKTYRLSNTGYGKAIHSLKEVISAINLGVDTIAPDGDAIEETIQDSFDIMFQK